MNTKSIKIQLPDYLTINQYEQLLNLDHLTDLERFIQYITIIAPEYTVEDIKSWDIEGLFTIGAAIQLAIKTEAKFIPVFEFNGIKYGYQPIYKMTIAEIADIEVLCKNTSTNFRQLFALLFRPITRNKIGDTKWQIEYNVKVKKEQVNNLYEYYDVEKYDSVSRKERAELFGELPINYALGAVDFFLGSATLLISNTKDYMSPEQKRQMMVSLSLTAGDGLGHYLTSPKPTYLKLGEKQLLLT